MRRSEEVSGALRRFYERFSSGDKDDFARGLTREEDALVIGTAPVQWEEGRATWVSSYGIQVEQVPGIRLEADAPRGYEEGPIGWAADRPRFILPDGTALASRVTMVFRREDGEWKVVQAHFSVGVPDEEVFELQRRWSA